MADAFGDEHTPLSDRYLNRLLQRPDHGHCDGAVVGGMTAHTLVMTTVEGSQIFIYDTAVSPTYQRRGVGRQLINALRREATRLGASEIFVPAEDEDARAIDSYSALAYCPDA